MRWFVLLTEAWKQYERDYARYFAIAMIYYALVALLPLLVLLLATAGLLLRFSAVGATAQEHVLQAIDAKFGSELQAAAVQLFASLGRQSVLVVILSVLGLMWTASVLVGRLRMGVRAIWGYEPPIIAASPWAVIRITLREKVIAFSIAALAEALLFATLLIIAALEWLSSTARGVPFLSWASTWLLAVTGSLILVPLSFLLLFMYLPPVRLRWREVWFAAVLCSAAWLLTTEVLALTGVFFGANFSAYSALGGVLAVMLWMSIVSQVLFYGAELCKVTHKLEPAARTPH